MGKYTYVSVAMKLSHPDCDETSTGLEEEEGFPRKSCYLITRMFASCDHLFQTVGGPSDRLDATLGAEKRQ